MSTDQPPPSPPEQPKSWWSRQGRKRQLAYIGSGAVALLILIVIISAIAAPGESEDDDEPAAEITTEQTEAPTPTTTAEPEPEPEPAPEPEEPTTTAGPDPSVLEGDAQLAQDITEGLGSISSTALEAGSCTDLSCVQVLADEMAQEARVQRAEFTPRVRDAQIPCLRRTGERYLSALDAIDEIDTELASSPEQFVESLTLGTERLNQTTVIAERCTEQLQGGG